MTGILLLATIVLGVLLFDTRRRLAVLEERDREYPQPMRHPDFAPPSDAGFEVAVELPPVPPEPLLSEDHPAPLAEAIPVEHFEAEPQTEHQPIALSADADAIWSEAPSDAPTKGIVAGSRFEDLFGRKLPIWAGGVTLIVAAVLMVKYSIDTGLLSPWVRVLFGMVFSAVLIGGAELARRREDLVQDPRVAQALAGAGVGGLYAATLAAANLYGLVGQGVAFAGLTAITALALGLALRFGVPCAVLGLVGGLATPAVVQSDAPSVPLLAGYLALVIGAITLLSRRQRWVWLGVGALTGGAGWTMVIIALGGLDTHSTASIGMLVLLLGLALPALAVSGSAAPALRSVAALVGAVQLATLVANGNFTPLTWGLYGLLSLAFVWLADRTAILRQAVALPLLTALGLTAFWPRPEFGLFGAVIAGITAIYGGYALRRLWREGGGPIEAGLVTAVALGGYAMSHARFYEGAVGQDLRFAMLALGFAAVPALGAALGWRRPERHDDARFALLASCAGVLTVVAGLVGLPGWTAPVVFAAVAAALLAIAIVGRDDRLAKGALLFLGSGVLALAVSGDANMEWWRPIEAIDLPHLGQSLLRWSAMSLAATAFARRSAGKRRRFALQPLAVLLGYGLVAQVVPAPWLAVAVAAALSLLAEADKRRPALGTGPALATLVVLLALWAVEPLAIWALAGLTSLGAVPVLAGDMPAAGMALRRVLVPALALGVVLWRRRADLPPPVFAGGGVLAGVLGLVGVHALYKQVFAIGTEAEFIVQGLAERCLWEAALLAAAVAAWRWLEARRIAVLLLAAALAHSLLYTLVLHDPLWTGQAVGPWPLANLLLPAFAIPFVVPMLAGRIVPEHAARLRRPGDILHMVLIALFAFATLRQLFAGTMLVGGGVTEAENIGRSVLGIALGIGFLVWGIRKGLRDWRIASLTLMLAAAGKVFLFDASGLEGLLRIGSFLALGFSLIGIGWLYSRYLKPDAAR